MARCENSGMSVGTQGHDQASEEPGSGPGSEPASDTPPDTASDAAADTAADETSIGATLAAFARHRDRVAISHADGEWTHGDLLDAVHRTARALRQLGVQRGPDTDPTGVALLTGNRPETFVLRYAAQLLGCTVTVLYDGLAPSRLAELLRVTGATTLVCDSGRAEAAQAAVRAAGAADAASPGAAAGVRLLTLGRCHVGRDLAERAANSSDAPIEVRARPEDVASIKLTGGSTGTPKGVPRTFRRPPYLSPEALAGWHDTVQLLCTPIAHLGGTLAEVILTAGGRVVLHERFDAGAAIAAIEDERVTYLWLQPRQLYGLLDHPALHTADFSALNSLTYGGAPAAPHRIAQAVRHFGPILAHGYGSLEAAQITWLTPEEHLRPELLTTVGRPVQGTEISIRDAGGEPVATGDTGEVWVRSRGVMTGYHGSGAAEQNAAVLKDGWFATGDLGHLDAEGYLTVAGRAKDVIMAASERVYPADVENVLQKHPGVGWATVFGTADVDGTESVCAAVVPARVPGQDLIVEQEVVSWVAERRGEAFAPAAVLLLDEPPTTGSGKPDREALRALAAQRLAVGADGRC